jgi:hypothetical protein
MNMQNPQKGFAAPRVSDISDDRELLDVLQMSDAQASMYLGKSRQALNNQLGSRRSGKAPSDYFKARDLIVLITAARSLGREFDSAMIQRYIKTRPRPRNDEPAGYALLDKVLGNIDQFELRDPSAIIFILPEFADLRTENREGAERLRDLVAAMYKADLDPWVVVLSSSEIRAKMATQWLGLSGDKVRSASHDYVDHYLPAILVYDREGDGYRPRPFVLTQAGSIVSAPQYRAAMMSECVQFMLPEDVRNILFPIGAKSPPDVKPQKPEGAEAPRRRTGE